MSNRIDWPALLKNGALPNEYLPSLPIVEADGVRVPIEAGVDERAIYTISGNVEIGGASFEPGQLVVFRPGEQILIKAGNEARFMLFGGAPIEGPRYLWWNFVSSRPERIEQTKTEWTAGKFDTVPGDESEFIPLPEDGRAVQRAEGGVHYP